MHVDQNRSPSVPDDRCIPVDQCVTENSRHDRRAAVDTACVVGSMANGLGRVLNLAGHEKGALYSHSDGREACVAEPSAQGNPCKRRCGGCTGGVERKRLAAGLKETSSRVRVLMSR